ncbi:ATP-dependent rna helicase dbp9 [Pseudohyphozyma bogoriensis]|nr:ATP-dependent rna helicase dbp9 [Pseudohyphozyma bogoriensis]
MSEPVQFSTLEPTLHPLLLRALSHLSFTTPTLVQSTLIPQALTSSRDILCRSRTGSGKTLAYAIPILQAILAARGAGGGGAGEGTKALILVPTRELAEQVRGQVGKLVDGLGEGSGIRVVNVAGGAGAERKKRRKEGGEREERMKLADRPEIVVATPSRALAHLRSEALHLTTLTHLVIDEADLILSYGHSSEDIRSILSGPWGLPQVYQSFLMSATMTGEVEELKGVVLRDPVTLKIKEEEDELAGLKQFYVRCGEEEKFLLLYVILKLKLIKGKCLIFVNDTDRGYRVKLFLEKFGIKSGVLNSELPFNSRYHAVQEFNRGVFDYLIATDESGLEGHDRDTVEEKEEGDAEGDDAPTLLPTQPSASTSTTVVEEEAPAPNVVTKKRKRAEASVAATTTEYGVSRGVDFIDVSCVLNFDLPFSSRSYTHRVGRTARAGRTGTSLSFVVPKDKWGKVRQEGVVLETAKRDESVWKRIVERNGGLWGETEGKEGRIREWKFDQKQVEGFRYRMEDGLRSVTKAAVREARVKEIKNEVVNSEKLKAHFEDNPRDLAFLRHDKPLHPSRVQPHLKHVPGYLMPRIAAVSGEGGAAEKTTAEGSVGMVPFHKPGKGGKGGRGGKSARGGKGKREDPLKGGKFSFGKGK